MSIAHYCGQCVAPLLSVRYGEYKSGWASRGGRRATAPAASSVRVRAARSLAGQPICHMPLTASPRHPPRAIVPKECVPCVLRRQIKRGLRRLWTCTHSFRGERSNTSVSCDIRGPSSQIWRSYPCKYFVLLTILINHCITGVNLYIDQNYLYS